MKPVLKIVHKAKDRDQEARLLWEILKIKWNNKKACINKAGFVPEGET